MISSPIQPILNFCIGLETLKVIVCSFSHANDAVVAVDVVVISKATLAAIVCAGSVANVFE